MIGHLPEALRGEVVELTEQTGWGYREVVEMTHAERRMWLRAVAAETSGRRVDRRR